VVDVLGVAEAKRRFSELMSRVEYRGERFIIQRHGRTMAALVPADDLDLPKGEPGAREGLMKAAGAWADFEGLEEIVKDIYEQREQSFDERTVDLED